MGVLHQAVGGKASSGRQQVAESKGWKAGSRWHAADVGRWMAGNGRRTASLGHQTINDGLQAMGDGRVRSRALQAFRDGEE